MNVTLAEYDIGCLPSPSVPAEMLIQDGWRTYVLFFAVSKAVDETGYLKDLGVAVLECVDCVSTKFGYPNDEGLPEHPLYALGLNDMSAYEVRESLWVQEIGAQQLKSTKRIWGSRAMDVPSVNVSSPSRHFILPLKEATFECVASALKVVFFAPHFDAAFEWVRREASDR